MTHPLKLTMDQPAEYLIIVQGRLDPERTAWFNGMNIEPGRRDGVAITLLRGLVKDQAALHGMLRTLYTLGIPLLDVRLCRPDASGTWESES